MSHNICFSVIIPTLNRSAALKETLVSIYKQNVLPEIIYVIDQSDNTETKNICMQFPLVVYVHSQIKSATTARNIGIRASVEAGMDFWVFLDDDVELDKDFFNIIRSAFSDNQHIVGIVAWVRPLVSNNRSLLANILRFIGGFDYNANKVKMRSNFLATSLWKRPSGEAVKVMWMTGGAMSVRNLKERNIFFDENLILYALAEDRDFSYRLSQIGNTVLLPNLQLLHKAAPEGRIPSRKKIFMIAVHQYYLTKKHFNGAILSSVMYWWNMCVRWGISILMSLYGFVSDKHDMMNGATDIRDAFYYVLCNREQIGRGDLGLFHRFLLEDSKVLNTSKSIVKKGK